MDKIWKSVSVAQPSLLASQFQKLLVATDNLWSFHRISRILYQNNNSFFPALSVCVLVLGEKLSVADERRMKD